MSKKRPSKRDAASARLEQAAVRFTAEQLAMRLSVDDDGSRAAAAWRDLRRTATAFARAKVRTRAKVVYTPKLKPIQEYGDHMTWTDYVDLVESGGINDDDGSGELATSTRCSDISCHPSGVTVDPPYPWVTHVVWYNK